MRAIGVVIAAGLTISGIITTAAETCNDVGTWTSTCSVENSGEQVDIGASIGDPGPPSSGENWQPGEFTPTEPAAPENDCIMPERCGGYLVIMPPDVTAADLASFRPTRPSLTGEPAGFGIVGAPTNVVAAASEQYLTGPLLGWDVTVRFVPAGFVFDYGDGSTARSATGGASWSSLGQAQFTPTATSHAYRERGTYPVSVTVQYAASVDFGSGTWRPVTGFVTASTGGYDVQVVEARTALVDKTCLENPGAPGC